MEKEKEITKPYGMYEGHETILVGLDIDLNEIIEDLVK